MLWHAKHFPTENLSIAGATIDIFHHKKLNFASAFRVEQPRDRAERDQNSTDFGHLNIKIEQFQIEHSEIRKQIFSTRLSNSILGKLVNQLWTPK